LSLEKEKNNVRALHMLAMINLRQNKTEELKKTIDKLLKECGENVWIVNDAGCMLASSCELERSLLVLIDGAKKYPRSQHIFANIGTILLEMGDAERSIGMFEAALNWHDEMIQPLLGLGNALRFLSRHSEAYEAYRKASALLDRSRGQIKVPDRKVWKEEMIHDEKTTRKDVGERLSRMMAFIGPTFHHYLPSVPEDRHDIPWPFRKNEHVFPFGKTLLLSQEVIGTIE
jgi:tetratricopeptide (TPR) repeat protein